MVRRWHCASVSLCNLATCTYHWRVFRCKCFGAWGLSAHFFPAQAAAAGSFRSGSSSGRRYKPGVYALPYAGEEVKLHWANADQYYIKTTEYFRDYTFNLPSGKKAHF